MSPELISIIVLGVMFLVATVLPINLGVIGFVAAFLVGTLLGGLSADDVFKGFPVNLFVLLVGITYLFAIAQNNGTVDLLTNWGLRLVRGNIGLIPWIMFALTAVLCGVGALSAAGVAIVAPIALRYAARYGINPLMMGILVVQGATAGSYSPVSPFGVITNGVLNSQGLESSPGLLFVNSLAFNAVVAVAVFVAFGGLRLMRERIGPEELAEEYTPDGKPTDRGDEDGSGEEGAQERGGGLTLYRLATLAGIALLVVLSLGFNVDVGFAALTIALGLALMAPRAQAGTLGQVPWTVILLVAGVLTYVKVLENIGTIDYVEGLVTAVGNPLLTALAASYVGGVISAFASTAGILGAAIPLAAPVLEDPTIPAIGAVTAIAISSAIVDVSPFSTNGALLLANVQNVEKRTYFRQLLLWATIITLLGPPLAWLVFVVIGVP
jgi:Na+/H+ antiporter NhaD/arsenite permease-like protein